VNRGTGGGLVERVELQVDDLARRMLDTIVREVPLYAHLPREQLDGEILAICRANLVTFLGSLRGGDGPSEAELAVIGISAARRAEERVPLEAVLTAYHVGGRVGWEALQAAARPSERDQLHDLAGGLMTYMQKVTSAVSAAYLEEQQAIYGEEREARRSVVEALLGGDPSAGSLAARSGIRLAPAYLAVALDVAASPDETDAGVSAAVAARRKTRRIEEALGGSRDGVLCLLHPGGGDALLPVPADEASAALARATELVEAVTKAAGADVWAGVSWRPGASAAGEAAAEAREILRLATSLGRPPGAYWLDDVLLEHAVSMSASVRDRLAALIAPLEDGPDLLATLQGWFDADFDRRRAAAALHVHPNTLDYRLRRVGELTGVDLGSAHGLQLLGAALTARRLTAS
jgi:hypothetical protein